MTKLEGLGIRYIPDFWSLFLFGFKTRLKSKKYYVKAAKKREEREAERYLKGSYEAFSRLKILALLRFFTTFA